MEYQRSCIGLDSKNMPQNYFDSNPKMPKVIPTISQNAQKYLKPKSNFSKLF
jgi:hypothetical protein